MLQVIDDSIEPTALAVRRSGEVLEAVSALNLSAGTEESSQLYAAIFPTVDGGIQHFWPYRADQLSIEVEPSGSVYIHTANVVEGTYKDALIAADNSVTGDSLAPWFSVAS